MENISPKEWLISVIVVVLTLATAVVVEPAIKDHMLDEIKTYQQALRVDNDSNTFSYAQKTNVGDVLAVGNVDALEPQSIPELQSTYGMIEKVKEHYTMHTRQVSHESCTGSGKNRSCTTYYTTEIYYTWDTIGRWDWNSQRYAFLGVNFSLSQLDISAIQRLELTSATMAPAYSGFYDHWNLYESQFFGNPSGNDRYSFYILPTKFAATIFVKFLNDTISEPITGGSRLHVYYSQTPEQVIQQKKDGLIIFDVVYYVLCVLIAGGAYLGWAYYYADVT